MRVIVGRPEDLAARDVLEGRGDAPFGDHPGRVERLGVAEAGQGRAIGAQQEDRLDQVAARLLDRQCRKRAVVAGAFGHHAVDREAQLLVDLVEREFGQVTRPAALVGQQVERVGDRRLSTFYRDVHVRPPRRCCAAVPAVRNRRRTRRRRRREKARDWRSIRPRTTRAALRWRLPRCRRCRDRAR